MKVHEIRKLKNILDRRGYSTSLREILSTLVDIFTSRGWIVVREEFINGASLSKRIAKRFNINVDIQEIPTPPDDHPLLLEGSRGMEHAWNGCSKNVSKIYWITGRGKPGCDTDMLYTNGHTDKRVQNSCSAVFDSAALNVLLHVNEYSVFEPNRRDDYNVSVKLLVF